MNLLLVACEFVFLLSVHAFYVKIDESLISLPAYSRAGQAPIADILSSDRHRIDKLLARFRSQHKRATASSISASTGLVDYTAVVDIGCPATGYPLIIDLGEPTISVNNYKQTSCSHKLPAPPPGPLGFTSEFTDTVALSTALVVTGQDIFVPSEAGGDGILGLGPGNGSIVNSFFSKGLIPASEVSLSFEPSNTFPGTSGEVTFGGTDASKFISPITFTPAQSTLLAEGLWGFSQSVKYGKTSILASTTGIVDSGTTLLLLPTSAYNKYTNATGATLDNATGLLKVTNAQLAALESLFFSIGGTTFEFTANAQIFPRALNTEIGGSANANYLIISDLGEGGSGLNFINGLVWMQRYYVVLDSGSNRVGFANTGFTNSTIN